MNFQLQLFNPASGRYVENVTGDNSFRLSELGRKIAAGDGFRVVNLDRKKPLPLKPANWYRRAPRYRLETSIEPARDDQIMKRAREWYQSRRRSGEQNIPVYVWRGSRYADYMRKWLTLSEFRIVELDPNEPGSAFGPLVQDMPERIAA